MVHKHFVYIKMETGSSIRYILFETGWVCNNVNHILYFFFVLAMEQS